MRMTIATVAAVMLGAGTAFAQVAAPAPEAGASVNAQVSADTQATDEQVKAVTNDEAAATAIVAGSAGAAAVADVEASADADLSPEELAKQKRAERKAKRRAQCMAINVGKPRDC